MNCPHCGKKIEDSKIVSEQTSEKKGASKENSILANGDLSAVCAWISTDAWNGYLEINCY
jgi:hypothetical protein